MQGKSMVFDFYQVLVLFGTASIESSNDAKSSSREQLVQGCESDERNWGTQV